MGLIQDVRHGLRLLRKRPVFTLTAVLTLALGIGVNTTIFSVANAFLVRALPFRDADRLVHVWRTDPHAQGWAATTQRVSVPDYLDFRADSQAFEELGAFLYQPYNVGGTPPEQVEGGRLTASMFRALGVAPRLGRLFTDEEERGGRHRVVVLSHRLWEQRHASDPGVLGRTLTLDGERYEIIGVMPEGFEFPLRTTRFWVPLPLDPVLYSRDGGYLQVAGRLKPGKTIQGARAGLQAISARLQKQYPDRTPDLGVNVVPLRQALLFFFGFFALMMVLLGIVAGLVQLMVCANLATLLLAQAAARTREIAVRAALGAGRRRLLRQLLVENLLLAGVGAAAGCAVAAVLTRLAARGLPEQLYHVGGVGLDAGALAFTLAVAVVTALFFGLVPALRLSRFGSYEALKEGAPVASAGPRSGRLLRLLVGAQVALSLVLLSAGVIQVRALLQLRDTHPGFDPRSVATAEIGLAGPRYGDESRVRAFHEDLLRRVSALPGVASAAFVHPLPLTFEVQEMEFGVEGRPVTPEEKLHASSLRVTPGYFKTMGIRLLAGREFEPRDTAGAPRVVIVNRALAEKYWPGKDPLGKRLADCTPCVADAERYEGFYEIVGLVEDTHQFGLWEQPQPQIYLAMAQAPLWRARLVARAAGGSAAQVFPALRGELAALDPDVPLSKERTMETVFTESYRPWSLATWFCVVMAGAALLLAAVGVYGVVACAVEQRTHELGVRLALGAGGSQVMRLVLRRNLLLLLIGVLPGVLLSLALSTLVASAATAMTGAAAGQATWDLQTPLAASLILLAGAGLASWWPARRAARIDVAALLRGA